MDIPKCSPATHAAILKSAVQSLKQEFSQQKFPNYTTAALDWRFLPSSSSNVPLTACATCYTNLTFQRRTIS